MYLHCIFPTFSEIPPKFSKQASIFNQTYSSKIFCHCSGTGQQVITCIDSIAKQGNASYILLLGYAGALDPNLQRGDIILCNQYENATGNILSTNFEVLQFWENFLQEQHIIYTICNCYTSDTVVSSVENKKNLFQKKYSIVDMENYYAAQQSQAYNIPFLSIRFILDTAQDELPDMSSTLTANGKIAPFSTMKYILQHPLYIPKMFKIFQYTKQVQLNLKTVCSSLFTIN
ncbi:MAG: hypothetical protein KBC30_07990 [Planctomycetes bacterium]|jgi:nucleoside phosphorylase|nr:hypothetical protein [Planctomycetota bacterium]HNZ66288.1 hypothetical protein [Planctomycetota bacterium]HPY74538.1 hypothetical protein [Planctomycetota bacterium]HQB00182.1 hypothetical protein [Planctomycetota bacterium]